MSRSYKKVGIVKQKYRKNQKIANRRFRSRNRIRIQQGQEPLESKELTNPYDVIDWIYMWDKSWWKRVYRDNVEEFKRLKRKMFSK